MPHIKRQIVNILNDQTLTKDKKVTSLHQLELDARAKERAATEGFTPVDGDDGEDLKAIEQALHKLGEPVAEPGAATL
jgi:hypothetical protein